MTRKQLTILLIILIGFSSCEPNGIPKPRGYFRIDLPPQEYLTYQKECPYSFEYNKSSLAIKNKIHAENPCWLNIFYPNYKGTIHLSYLKVNNNINNFIEDSRKLVYKHTIKANAINENRIVIDSCNVYGLVYELEGNAASAVQFYVTDSINHFLRGALYFNARTNADSLYPVANYIKEDIYHLIRTLKWEKTEA